MNQTEIQSKLERAVQRVMERGFRFPIHVVFISANGAIYASSWKGVETTAFVMSYFPEHTTDPEFQPPIYVTFVDGNSGDAVHVVIKDPKLDTFTLQ
jgi:hypothetical protein